MKKNFFLLFIILPAFAFSQTSAKNSITDKMPGSDCNNVVEHDKFAGAPDRSPSECESQFDWKVRSGLRDAFSKALQNFPAKDWIIIDTAVEELREIGRGSEKIFFNLSYNFKIDLNPESAIYRSWYEKYEAAMEQIKLQPGEVSYKNFADFNYKMNNAIHIRFYVLVNDMSERIYFLKGGQQVINVPGAAFAVKGPYAGALSGGGDENSMDACFIVFGKPKVSTQIEDNGGATVITENNFPKGTSRLTVQEISIRIECNDELLNKILKETDLKLLAGMIGK